MGKKDFCDWWTDARIIESDIAWQRERQWEDYARRILHASQLYGIKSVLEVGCGMAYVGNEITDILKYTGIDGNARVIESAQKKFPYLDIRHGNIRSLRDILQGKRDIVCAFATLKHFAVEDYKTILAKMLEFGEYGLFDVQITPSLSFDIIEEEYYQTYINSDTLVSYFREINCDILQWDMSATIPMGNRLFVLVKNCVL